MGIFQPRWTFAGVILISVLAACKQEAKDSFLSQDDVYKLRLLCNAEQVKEGKFVLGDSVQLDNGETQDEGQSYSGKASSRIDAEHPYSFHLPIKLSLMDTLEVSVWRYSESGSGVLSMSEEGGGDYRDVSSGEEKYGKWEKLVLNHVQHKEHVDKPFKILVWHPQKKGEAWFDDFEVNIKKGYEPLKNPEYDQINYTLDFPEKTAAKLDTMTAKAIKKGFITDKHKKWKKAQITRENIPYEVRIRLKGDLLDHVLGEKRSYRVKCKTELENGIHELALQSPSTRGFLKEWVWHKLLQKEGLLTTFYAFRTVDDPTRGQGVYAMEEHFTRALLDRTHRPEGYVLKFDEGRLWKSRHRKKPYPEGVYLPFFEAAQIKAFNTELKEKSSGTYAGFLKGIKTLNEFRYSLASPNQLFDVEKLAKYFAVMDLTGSYHAFIWHNQRWFFNLETEKLEPIGFDGYTEAGVEDWLKGGFIGFHAEDPNFMQRSFPALYNIMHDESFFNLYHKELTRVSDSAFVEQFLGHIDSELNEQENLLKTEYTNYRYDAQFLRKNAAEIRENLRLLAANKIPLEKKGNQAVLAGGPITVVDYDPVKYVSLTVYREKNKAEVELSSFYPKHLEIIGWGTKEELVKADVFQLEPYLRGDSQPLRKMRRLKEEYTHVHYRVKGTKKVIKQKIKKV